MLISPSIRETDLANSKSRPRAARVKPKPTANGQAAREPFHWRSAISWKDRDRIVCHGYEINELADKISFTDMVFLLFQGELPTPEQEKMLTHIMVVFVEHAFSPSTV